MSSCYDHVRHGLRQWSLSFGHVELRGILGWVMAAWGQQSEAGGSSGVLEACWRRVGGMALCSHSAGRAVPCVPPGPGTGSAPPQAMKTNRAAVISTKTVQCLP